MTNAAFQQLDQQESKTKLRDEWRIVRFGDVVSNVDINERDPLASGLERYIGLGHIDPESLHIKRWGLIEEGTSFTRKFVKGQVLFGKRRAYQRKVAVADFDGICSGDILVFEAKNDLLPELLPFIVQSEGFYEYALSTSAGSLSPRTKWKDLAAYEFALPPKDEQRRIADILWAVDEVILSWRIVERKINELLKAIREYEVCASKHRRQQLGDFLISIVPGRSVLGINKPADPDKFGVLKVSAVGAHDFVASENKQLLNPSDFRPEFQVRAGDFLITRCNTRELVGKVCIVTENHNNLMLCDKTLRLDLDDDQVCKEFILEALRSKELRTQIEAAASGTGGAMKNISQADIRQLMVPIPNLETQKKIVSMIQVTEQARRSVETHLAQTILYRITLLHELLT